MKIKKSSFLLKKSIEINNKKILIKKVILKVFAHESDVDNALQYLKLKS